ncbi:MAG TPA: DUF456 domain-containing protein [Vicinamibacterales bacterium]|nr:DUF456 domain-containing protein [Vicinamibacterales bacterium]
MDHAAAVSVVPVLMLVVGVLVTALGVVLLPLPAIPALGVIFMGVFLAAWADGFARIGWFSLAVMLALTVFGSLADNIATLIGARRAGASWWGVAGATAGMVVGMIFGLPGIIAGPAIGAFAFEYARNPDFRAAGWAGAGGVFGFLLGIVAKSAFGMVIVGIAVLTYFFY